MEDQKKSDHNSYPQEEEYFFRNTFKKRKEDVIYLWKYRTKIVAACISGLILGALLAWLWPVSYTSRLTFVVEESQSSTGSLSALAGQFGFDLGNLTSSNSVLAGDNVQAFLKSYTLIRKTLLSPYNSNSDYSLADRYAESSHLKSKWGKYVKKGQEIRFPTDTSHYTRLQDSLVQDMTEQIIDKNLSVSKPDKKLSFFEADITMRDEKLSMLFCSRLIEAATTFYISTKTQRLRTDVNTLQARADSLEKALNKKTYSASAATQMSLDANPAYPTSTVTAEVQARDKTVLATIYAEVVKQLESSRMMLSRETPTFQIVDEPRLTVKKNRLHYLETMLACMILTVVLYSLSLLLTKKEYQN
jgi:hypothetical protein